MKKQLKKTIATIALVAICLSVVGLSFLAKAASVEMAQTFMTTEAYTDDVYVFGGNVVVDEDVNGDLIIFGGNVEVTANVTGDVFIAGGQVNLQGEVGDDVRMVAGWLTFNGIVGDDLMVAGASVSMASNSIVQGDVYGASGNLNSNGQVLGDFEYVAGNMVFNGEVLGDATLISESSIKISNNAKIHGNLEYRASKTIDVEEGVVVGVITFKEFNAFDFSKAQEDPARATLLGSILMKIWSFLTLIVIGVLLMLAIPYTFRNTSEVILQKYWKSLLYGVVFVISIPVVAVLLMFTIVGFKLSIVLLILLAVVWLIAKLYAGYFLGSLIFRPKKKTAEFWPDFRRMTLGLVIVMLVEMVPGIGMICSWAIVFTAIGGMVLYNESVLLDLRRKKVI